jgi:hypothetical protein
MKKKDYTRDFNDIEYFIDHVSNIDARIDVIQKLGYKIGVDVVTKETDKVKKVIIGKRGEMRIQIAPSPVGIPLAKCVILT